MQIPEADTLELPALFVRATGVLKTLLPGFVGGMPLNIIAPSRLVHRSRAGSFFLPSTRRRRAIERCRTAALGGHVARCENAACGHTEIAYNSCRNRHCPKCQGAASRRWLA